VTGRLFAARGITSRRMGETKSERKTRSMTAQKTLRLSYHNGLLCGVCGGIAEWLGWKPRAVRALYVLLSVFSAMFPGLLVYLILYFLLPGPDLAIRPSMRHDLI
jgi:phage shock protein C